jgi:hypothetical protein
VSIVIVTLPTARGKSPTIILNLPGAIPKFHTGIVWLLSIATKLPILHHQILGPLTG